MDNVRIIIFIIALIIGGWLCWTSPIGLRSGVIRTAWGREIERKSNPFQFWIACVISILFAAIFIYYVIAAFFMLIGLIGYENLML